jgi:hypothetical protein
MHKGFAAVAALALLAGCGGGEPVAETNVVVDSDTSMVVPAGDSNAAMGNGSAAAPTAFQLGDDGLWLTLADGRTQRSGFGVSREIAVPMIASALGPQTDQGTNSECGAGPLDNVDFKDGLTLFFQNGRFVGWSLDGRVPTPYKTTKGIGIGSTLQQLRDTGDVAVQETSLGSEFAMGELYGLVTSNTPDGTITSLWAGTTCAFR